MDSKVFCVLCGGPFDLEHHIYSIDPQTEAYQWLYDARLLGERSALRSLRLGSTEEERPVNISGSDDIFLSKTTRWTTTDSDCFSLQDTYYQTLSDTQQGDLIFPLHHACIQIASKVLKSHPEQSGKGTSLSNLACLYQLLQLRFRHRKYFAGLIGHDILDLNMASDLYGPRSLLAMDTLGWWGDDHEKFLTDPMDVPDLTKFVIQFLDSTPERREFLSRMPCPSRQPQPLEALPMEILDRITDFLPPRSISQLHTASKFLATKVPLNDRFWRERLLDGSLMPHLWDLKRSELITESRSEGLDRSSVKESWDWSSVVKVLFRKEFPVCCQDLRLQNMPPGFWNRCRIWKVIEELYKP